MMKRNSIDRARRSVKNKNYSDALYNLHNQYNHFYNQKYQISKLKINKSFKMIANSDCEMYARWRKGFQELDMEGSVLLKNIQANSETSFESITGENILEKTFTVRKHCKTFFDLREL